MTGQFILADVTSHRRGFGVQPIVNSAARRNKQPGDPTRVLWLVPTQLISMLPSILSVQVCDTVGPLLWSTIEQKIAEIKATSPDTEIIVATWDQFVWERARNFGPGVTAVKWSHWLDEDRAIGMRKTPGRILRSPQFPVDLPLTEKLGDLVIQYLRSIKATSETVSVYRSQLRPALLGAFPDLRASSLSPTFGLSLKAAVDRAIRDGRLVESRPLPGQERLWVTGAYLETPSLEAVDSHEKTSRPGEKAERKNTSPVYARSAEFRKRLTELGIFCEKRERDILMDALRRILQESV